MANPMYHDDPDWYERPGETVPLHVDVNPAKHIVPSLPWVGAESMADRAHDRAVFARYDRSGSPCVVCGKPTRSSEHLTCDSCARAQQRDETEAARARQPTPSRARISVRESWEVWAAEQPPRSEGLDSGHVRSYETRIA